MNEPKITIRRAETIADYMACQQAQKRAWGLTEESYVVPLATMVGAQLHGGLVLGAFLPDGEAVGVSFAFLGRSGNRSCLYSQLTGVVPGYQGQGIGSQFKTFQRDYAKSIGIAIIAWSFDPLQAGNARFNLNRLGARCCRYIENMYGPRSDALNTGVPTDRLIAEWPTEDRQRRIEPVDLRKVSKLVEGPDEPKVMSLQSIKSDGQLSVEVPRDIAQLRAEQPDRAERWRRAIATSMSEAFQSGFVATDFIDEAGRSFYLLEA